MAKKRILVACGTGIATSVAVANKIKNLFEDKGYGDKVEFGTCAVAELHAKAHKYDLVVTTAHNSKELPVPVIMGVAFLIGRGTEPVFKQIMDTLGL
ncbi:MAG: PTS sugar transporter subunit IIB [Anaeromicrobium sp.]|jgi:PTS system galactitol-specific IIB component|uniref:PTS sugar transporter subunit IIB n=1 Tax=Anaeromicrobium sp. TaxID=1929132 RepID=UPI0025F35FAB|nr:PTS sugar transporter subunit IIB [Anaeromicrobium sp.]MCT4593914.1 PTS sugar transporter subunit IIB [Anaeromicrobium sp.]